VFITSSERKVDQAVAAARREEEEPAKRTIPWTPWRQVSCEQDVLKVEGKLVQVKL